MSELSEDLIARLRIGFDVDLTESVLFEAAGRIEELEARVQELEALAIRSLEFKSPCPICNYNGPGFYQPDQHSCAKYYHGD